MMTRLTLTLSAIVLASLCLHPQATTTRSLSSNDDNFCPPNLSGPDCTIPFEQCPDETRRCFNNSRCVRNNRIDPVLGRYGYSCDCSFASRVSKYAGFECEHSASVVCDDNNKGATPHFCTNGGQCGDYVYKAQIHEGCHCPVDYAGAHCQYLKDLVDFDELEGESLIGNVGDNFYGFTPKPRESDTATGIAIGICLGVVVALTLALAKGLAVRRNGGRFTAVELNSPREHGTGARNGAERFQINENPDAEII